MADKEIKTSGIDVPINVDDNASKSVDRVSQALDNLGRRQQVLLNLSTQFKAIDKTVQSVGTRLSKFTKELKIRTKTASVNNRSPRYGGLFTDEISKLKTQYSENKKDRRSVQENINLNTRKLVLEKETYALYERMNTLLEQITNKEIARLQTSNQLKQNLVSESDYVQGIVEQKKTQAILEAEATTKLAQDKEYINALVTKEKQREQINKSINAQVGKNITNIKTLSDRVSLFIGKIRRFTFLTYFMSKITNAINTFSKASADWTENLNLFEVSFGERTQENLDKLLKFADALGVSRNQVVKASSDFQTLANSIGLASDISADFSVALTQLGYDIGSLRNLDFEDVFEKLQSTIYGGQVKTARTLGINITASGLNELLQQLGLVNVKFTDLSESQKVLLRGIAAFKQLGIEGANVYGDLGKTITSLANRVRVFQASFQNLKLSLSEAFNSLFSNIIAVGTSLIQALDVIAKAFIPQKLTSGFNSVADSIDNATDSADELGEALGLLNIDKFNVLGKSSQSEGLQSTTAQLQEEFRKYIEQFNKATKVTEVFDEKVTSLRNKVIQFIFPLSEVNKETGEITLVKDKINPTIDAFVKLGKSIKDLLDTLKEVFNWLWENILPVILKLFSAITSLINNATVLKTLIFAIIATKIGAKLGGFVTKINEINSATDKAKIATTEWKSATEMLTKGFASLAVSLTSIISSTTLSSWEKLLGIFVSCAAAAVAIGIAVKALSMNWGQAIGLGATVMSASLAVYSTLANMRKYKDGGIVEDGVFTMSKGEIVGKFNDGSTVVANNMQIIQGIKKGVAEAVKESLGSISGKQTAVFNLNGKEFARATFNDYNYVGKTNTGFSWGGNKQ